MHFLPFSQHGVPCRISLPLSPADRIPRREAFSDSPKQTFRKMKPTKALNPVNFHDFPDHPRTPCLSVAHPHKHTSLNTSVCVRVAGKSRPWAIDFHLPVDGFFFASSPDSFTDFHHINHIWQSVQLFSVASQIKRSSPTVLPAVGTTATKGDICK